MVKTIALKIISVISFGGLLFSGYLSFGEMFGNVCKTGGCSLILGLPTCIYGFIMYLAVLIVSLIGLFYGQKK